MAAVVAGIGTTVAVLTTTEASVAAAPAASEVATTAVWTPERAPVASDPDPAV